jgi:hypothetical protein
VAVEKSFVTEAIVSGDFGLRWKTGRPVSKSAIMIEMPSSRAGGRLDALVSAHSSVFAGAPIVRRLERLELFPVPPAAGAGDLEGVDAVLFEEPNERPGNRKSARIPRTAKRRPRIRQFSTQKL